MELIDRYKSECASLLERALTAEGKAEQYKGLYDFYFSEYMRVKKELDAKEEQKNDDISA